MTDLVILDGEAYDDDHVLAIGEGETPIDDLVGASLKKVTDDEMGAAFSITTESATAGVRWNLAVQPQFGVRFYIKKQSAWPISAASLLRALGTVTSLTMAIGGTGAPGQVRFVDSATSQKNLNSILTLDHWYRIEWYCDSATQTYRTLVYIGHGTTPIAGSVTPAAASIPVDVAAFLFGVTNSPPSTNIDLLIAHLKITDDASTLIGPAVEVPPSDKGGFSIWNGAALAPAHIAGVWNGTSLAPAHIAGVWDGTSLAPVKAPGDASLLPDIAWTAGVWADEPGFTPPASGAVLTTPPTNLNLTSGGWYIGTAPTWVADTGGSGRPAFGFPEGNHRFGLNSPTYGNASLMTVAIVGRVTDARGGDLIDGPTSARRLVDSDGSHWRMYGGSAVIQGGTADLDLHLFIAEYRSSGLEVLEIDGTPTISAEGGGDSNGALIVGSSSNGDHHGSEVAFAGFIDRLLTSGEKADLLTWYRSHYLGIS